MTQKQYQDISACQWWKQLEIKQQRDNIYATLQCLLPGVWIMKHRIGGNNVHVDAWRFGTKKTNALRLELSGYKQNSLVKNAKQLHCEKEPILFKPKIYDTVMVGEQWLSNMRLHTMQYLKEHLNSGLWPSIVLLELKASFPTPYMNSFCFLLHQINYHHLPRHCSSEN